MFRQFLNVKSLLAFIAILIVTATIFYSRYLSHKIANDERAKVELWVEASKALMNPENADTRLPFRIMRGNVDIPIIETDEKDSILFAVNLDSAKAINPHYLQQKLNDFKAYNKEPITWIDPLDSTKVNRFYYGSTKLLNEVRYYPLVQLFIVGLFIIITILSLRTSYLSVQNQVWAGMAKETAHQLGTPVSSLEGWVEMLKDNPSNETIAKELEKDVDRLRLISDRFGKIGSIPQLEETELLNQISLMVDYIRKRAPGSVQFTIESNGKKAIKAKISPPLFDWVIENLLKNALDAMDGKGAISVVILETSSSITIDVSDTGKGISKANISKVFNPGFTTKKRGWGLGLSLTKRIIHEYHQGEIFVKNSEMGKGTTFRIVLKK